MKTRNKEKPEAAAVRKSVSADALFAAFKLLDAEREAFYRSTAAAGADECDSVFPQETEWREMRDLIDAIAAANGAGTRAAAEARSRFRRRFRRGRRNPRPPRNSRLCASREAFPRTRTPRKAASERKRGFPPPRSRRVRGWLRGWSRFARKERRIRRRAASLERANPARAAQLKQSLNLWTKPQNEQSK